MLYLMWRTCCCMAKFKCGGCKRYKTEVYKSNGVQRWCSRECVELQQRRNFSQNAVRSHVRPSKPRKQDIPVEVRKRVMKRDKGRCRFCGTNTGLHLHHVVYRSQGGLHEESNLITLCHQCHAIVHEDKKRWMPLLLGVIWKTYMGERFTVPMFERWLDGSVRT